MRRYAAELVALAPDVILASSSGAVAPLLQATRTVPIVFTAVADPDSRGAEDGRGYRHWFAFGRLGDAKGLFWGDAGASDCGGRKWSFAARGGRGICGSCQHRSYLGQVLSEDGPLRGQTAG